MREPANPGDLKFKVAPDLDWKAGDLLGLAPTNMDATAYEYVTIKSYNAGSGEVEAEEKLKAYHYGAPDSTGDKYRGVDMRGEVLLLSRNIMITSNQEKNSTHLTHPDPWPCRVIVADFFEPSDLTLRTGEIMWDGIGIHDCSQTETEHAALKFINAAKGDKFVKNSVLARGNGIGIDIATSKKVKLQNNAIFDMVEYGVRATAASDITLEDNILVGVTPNMTRPGLLMEWENVNGGFELIDASSMTVRNNTAAGTWHSGFRVPGVACEASKPSNVIEDNIAHSISGFGALVPEGEGDCSKFTKFYGYKNAQATVFMNTGKESRAEENISIDSHYGIVAFAGQHVEVRNNYIYGSEGMQNTDCPGVPSGKCDCDSRLGAMAPTFGGALKVLAKAGDIGKLFKVGGGWGGTSLFEGNEFIGFDSPKSACGGSQHAVGNNIKHSDYHPQSIWKRNSFINTDEKAMFKLYSPPQGWAN